jgi:hypothetical protein
MFANAMQSNLTVGTVLDGSISADVIAVCVGADYESHPARVNPKLNELSLCFFKVANIPRINENGLPRAIDKVVAIQVSALNEKEIVHDFDSFHYCTQHLSVLTFRLVSPDGS